MDDDKATLQNAYQTAQLVLSMREHSALEIQQKLLKKGYSPHVIAIVVDKLQKENLQSNARYIESFIRSKVAKGYGPNYILPALSSKGISQDEAKYQMEELTIDWREEANRVFKKKFKAPGVDSKTSQKQMRFMLYRGFSHDVIRALFQKVE